jgi:hypothetical protein
MCFVVNFEVCMHGDGFRCDVRHVPAYLASRNVGAGVGGGSA